MRALLLLFMAVCAGCASAPVDSDPVRFEPTLSYRLLVATPVVDFEREEWNGKPSRRFSVEADAATLQAALVTSLQKQGPFQEIGLLPLAGGKGKALGRAAEDGADLLLETRIRRRVASYLGSNGLYLPNLFLWVMAWVPSWWVKDETFALEIEVDVDLRSVHSGRSVYSGLHRVKSEEDLNDFQRGWQFLGIFRVPGSLDPENWRSVDQALAPRAEAKLSRQVATGIGKELERKAGTEEFRRAFARRYALVIGLSSFDDYRMQKLLFADRDAAAFHEHLTRPGGIPEHNTRLLLNGEATLSGIRSALAEFTGRGSKEGDEILIYFAGYGAWSEDQAYLLPYDADSARPQETGLALGDLVNGVTEGEGPRITLVLDSPFLSRFQGRAAAEAELPGDLGVALGGILRSPDHQVLSACNVGEACVELEDLGQGLFTYYLIQGLEGRGDRDRNGKVTWDEAYAFAGQMAGAHARVEGKVQRPGLYRGTVPATTGEEEARDE